MKSLNKVLSDEYNLSHMVLLSVAAKSDEKLIKTLIDESKLNHFFFFANIVLKKQKNLLTI